MNIPIIGKLGWEDWFLGLMGAFVGGGAGAVSSGVSMIFIDPAYVASHGAGFMLKLAGGTFLGAGISGAALYLKQKPVPVKIQETSEQRTETMPSGKVIETATQTKTTEPVAVPSTAASDTKEN